MHEFFYFEPECTNRALLEGREKVLCGWRMCMRWGGFPGGLQSSVWGQGCAWRVHRPSLIYVFDMLTYCFIGPPAIILSLFSCYVLSVGEKKTASCTLIKYSPPKQCCCSFFLTVVSVIDFMNTFAQVYSFCPTAKRQHADRKNYRIFFFTDAMQSDKLNFWCILDLTFSCVIKVKFS